MNLEKILYYFEFKNIKKIELFFVLAVIIICILLFIMPTGFEGAVNKNLKPVKAEVISVNNSMLHVIGLIKTGGQYMTIKIKKGKFKGEKLEAVNNFFGKLELDKVYKKGDNVFVVLNVEGNEIKSFQVIDKYRINYEIILVVIFILNE